MFVGLIVVLMTTALGSVSSVATNICGANATIGLQVVRAFNLSTLPVAVQNAAAAANYDTFCSLVAAFYVSDLATASWLRIPAVPPGHGDGGVVADQALEDIFVLSGVNEVAHIPRLPDGFLNWTYLGPRNDIEFMNCLNRHSFFVDLFSAYVATGNETYAAKVGDLVFDWVVHLPCNPCVTGSMESPWRTLEAGIRMTDVWPIVFYGFQGTDAFNTSSRVLMLLGASEHGRVLHDYGTAGAPNWRMQQWAGLANLALAFPQLANSSVWLDTALAGMQTELSNEVYPDGVETEQASGYDQMSALNFYAVLTTLTAANRTASAAYRAGVEQMFNYLALVVSQVGALPRNGDADWKTPWPADNMQAIMAFFNRSDWKYVTTAGTQGTPPAGPASMLFPWAGQLIFRSGYSVEDQWGFFDIGPYGSSGHAHCDKLHLNIRAFGSVLLVDSGRFAYGGTGAVYHAEYAPTTRAHNTLTFDGLNQAAAPATASAPVANNTYVFGADADWAMGSMADWAGLVGTATHTRAVHYAHARYWLVVDIVDTDRARAVQATWHTHPNSTVTVNGANAVVTGVPKGFIAVIPGGPNPWSNISVVHAQQPPEFKNFQGWYSDSYIDCRPSSTVVYDVMVTAGRTIFMWLLVPSLTLLTTLPSATLSSVNASVAVVSVDGLGGGSSETVVVPIAPLQL